MLFDWIQLNLGRDGLEMVFKPWEAEVMQTFWRNPARSFKSLEIYQWPEVAQHGLSRAAIISFLEKMCLVGVLESTSESGRGGYHQVYSVAVTEEQFWNRLTNIANVKLAQVKE